MADTNDVAFDKIVVSNPQWWQMLGKRTNQYHHISTMDWYIHRKKQNSPAHHKIYHQSRSRETHVESSWSFTLQNLHDSIKGSCIVLSSTTHIISHTSFQGFNGCHCQNSFRNSTTGTSQHAFRNGQLALIILEKLGQLGLPGKGGWWIGRESTVGMTQEWWSPGVEHWIVRILRLGHQQEWFIN